MKNKSKIIATIALSATLLCAAFFGGCGKDGVDGANGKDGRDGRDGQNVSIYEIWEAVKDETNRPELTFNDFIKEYLSYDSPQLEQTTSLQTTINRSLLSGVSIITEFNVTTQTWNPFTHKYQYSTSTETYAGSGVIIDVDKDAGDMYVVTNCHVVYDSSADGDGFCDNISLYLYGGEYFDNCKITAEIVGASKNYDLAVLKVSGSDVVKNSDALAAEWVDGEEAYIGESVYAVGNPEGEKMSVTVGIISKDSEDISVDLEESSTSSSSTSYRVLRTDAAINGGNSGGGLFNTQGKVVGIINAKTVSEEVDNMGYALPAATSKRVVQNILDAYEGTETHGINKALIGITTTIQSSYSYFNSQTNLTEIVDDVVVYSVDSTSKFASGLQVDDVIQNVTVTSADGTVKENMTVNRQHNISDAMLSVRAGDTVTLLVKRGDETFTVSATYAAGDLTSYS